MFTPLEGPAAYSGDEDEIPFGANTGLKPCVNPPHWKVIDLLTGFTPKYIVFVGQAFRPAYCKSVRLETEAEALPYEM